MISVLIWGICARDIITPVVSIQNHVPDGLELNGKYVFDALTGIIRVARPINRIPAINGIPLLLCDGMSHYRF